MESVSFARNELGTCEKRENLDLPKDRPLVLRGSVVSSVGGHYTSMEDSSVRLAIDRFIRSEGSQRLQDFYSL